MFENIKRWRLKRKIPEITKGKKWRYEADGITKVPVDEDNEVKDYQDARKRLKEQEKKYEL